MPRSRIKKPTLRHKNNAHDANHPALRFTPPPAEGFAEALLRWFTTAMRSLPWRETYAPYSVWISEIMLQQTQMERGVRFFNAWMQRFPDLRSVAEASDEAILAAWEGLGYYSRARNLHAAAKYVMREYGGEFPRSVESIRTLPGVGEYTAGAVAAIAFNAPEPAVDANVLRIFSRLCDIDVPLSGKGVREFVTETVRALIPVGAARLFCQALMELGALVCGKAPRCAACPLPAFCLARQRGVTGERPAGKTRQSYRLLEMTAAVIIGNGRVFIRKRPATGLWAGLWEFPCGDVMPGETPEEALSRILSGEKNLVATVGEKIASVRHGYTTHRVLLHGFLCDTDAAEQKQTETARESAWVGPEEIARRAFPAGHRKLLERLGWKTGSVQRKRGAGDQPCV